MMHGTDSSKIAKGQTSLKTYASSVFQESSFGTLSNIVQANSKKRKGLKVFFLTICFTGFMYQSGRFLMSYLRYPATLDVDIQKRAEIMMPAYTFCDNNGMKRSIFCHKFPDKCEKADDEFCKKYGSYCGVNKTLVPKKEYHRARNYVPQEEIIHFSANLSEFLSINNIDQFKEEATGPYLRLRKVGHSQLMLCYSWNGRVDNDFEIRMTSDNLIMKLPKNILTFSVEEDETFIPGDEAGVLFAIHSPFDAVNPFEDGIFLKPGKTYSIYISMDIEILLESPYETDCLNYEKLWQKNNRTGPRSKDMCFDKCLQKLSMMCFNCVFPVLMYPTSEKLCEGDDIWTWSCKDAQITKECGHCKDSCNKTKYKYKVQERSTMKYDHTGNEVENIDNKIIVEVYMEGNEILVWQHSPKYLMVEVFSTVGGFIGIWLGMSLLDITDIFEGVFRVIRHSLIRRR